MEEKLPSAGQSALYYALLLGVGLIIVHLVLYLLEMQTATAGNVISFAALIVGLVLVQLDFRNKKLNGFISYGKAVKIGFLTVMFAGIIVAVYTYIYSEYINPGDLIARKNESLQTIYNSGYSPEMEAQAIKNTEMYTTPLVAGISVAVVYAVMGILLSLITSIFIKKEEKVSFS